MYAVTLVPAIWSGWNLICLRKKENPKEGTRIRNIHAENNHLICVFFFLNKNCVFLFDQLNLFQILIYLVIFTSKKEKKKINQIIGEKIVVLSLVPFFFPLGFWWYGISPPMQQIHVEDIEKPKKKCWNILTKGTIQRNIYATVLTFDQGSK